MKIISEIGINYNADFRKIEEMVRQSAFGGADFAKFQLYSSQRVFGDDSRKHNELTFEQTKEISEICKFYEIEFFASVFDSERLAWCNEIGVKYFKIASRTVVKEPELCEEIISQGKTTYISLGFWNHYNSDGSVSKLPYDRKKHKNIHYLHCISKYPTASRDYKSFVYDENVIGLSDHSYGISFMLLNLSRGAEIIEKHFTLSKSLEGNDHIGSMDLDELINLRKYGDEIYKINSHI